MRDGGYFSLPPPPLPPPPPPSLNHAAADSHPTKMLASVIMALFLPCAGMSLVFAIYICLLWYATNNRTQPPDGKPAADKGLSASELEKVPKVMGKELVMGNECAVCLDEIDGDQAARMVPGCNHGFHLQCADTWLLKHPVCPVCRTKLDHLFNPSLDSPC